MEDGRIELADDSVYGCALAERVHGLADPAAELAETRRVRRSGGRLALSVCPPQARNPWASIGGLLATINL